MRYIFLAMIVLALLVGVNSMACAAQEGPASGAKSGSSQKAEPAAPTTGEENQGTAVSPASRHYDEVSDSTEPASSGEEKWQTYDENTGLPDATQSDRLGEVE